MKEGWVKVFSAKEEFKAKIAEDILKQNNILSHIFTKPDTAYPVLGDADLYAPQEDAERAVEILKKEGVLDE